MCAEENDLTNGNGVRYEDLRRVMSENYELLVNNRNLIVDNANLRGEIANLREENLYLRAVIDTRSKAIRIACATLAEALDNSALDIRTQGNATEEVGGVVAPARIHQFSPDNATDKK